MGGEVKVESRHGHWAHYDESLEMAEFDRLHAIVAGGRVPDSAPGGDLDRLLQLAQSYGYGEADSHLTMMADKSAEEIESDPYLASLRDAYEALGESDYHACIARSEELLRRDAHSEDQRRAVASVCDAVRRAVWRGRTMREEGAFEAGQAVPTAPSL